MNEFIKTEIVSDSDYIQSLVNANLQKDLHGDEEVCQYCHGTGLVIENNRYGLSDDPDKRFGRFPYKHQSISFCQHCFNGVIHRCKLCGEIMPKGVLRHDCDQQMKVDAIECENKRKKLFDEAKIAPDEVVKGCVFLYSDDYDYNNGYFSDWNEFFESWNENHSDDDERPEFVWITESEEMHIDANDIVSSATEDLYEDAIDNISYKDIEELQKFLDEWCASCGVGKAYYESHKYKIRIPWENYL